MRRLSRVLLCSILASRVASQVCFGSVTGGVLSLLLKWGSRSSVLVVCSDARRVSLLRMATTDKKAVESVQVFGRKRNAVAVAYCKRGMGIIKVNGMPIEHVEPQALRYKALEPILLLGFPRFQNIDIRIRVSGGGYAAQIYAIRQCIAKSLVAFYQKCTSPFVVLVSCFPRQVLLLKPRAIGLFTDVIAFSCFCPKQTRMRPPRPSSRRSFFLTTALCSSPTPVVASPRSSEARVPAPASRSPTVKLACVLAFASVIKAGGQNQFPQVNDSVLFA